jgi:hypothetical protein
MIFRWWRMYQRRLDKQLLWPACKEEAPDLETARTVFLLHTEVDQAWSDVSRDEAVTIISRWT